MSCCYSMGSGSRLLLGLLALSGLIAVSGCATYESHYSRFTATNSAGEPREFLLSWKTARYPSWAMREDVATPVRLETQCSDRVWLLRDDTMAGACAVTESQEAAAGIRACGQPGRDLDHEGHPLSGEGHQCMSIWDEAGSKRILELDNELMLTVSCYPDPVSRQAGEETVNVDYLKASVVPYSIHTRAAPLYSMNAGPPALDKKACEAE